MDEQILAQIFEPFFTTKESAKGTGLGLATARVVFMSGCADGGAYAPEAPPTRTAFLQKPFTFAGLKGVVRELLAANSSVTFRP